MIKKLIIPVALLLFMNTVKAQEAEKAKQILDQVSAKTKSFTTIFATFSITIDNQQENIKESHDGSIKIKGNKYAVDLMDTKSFFDGQTLYTYMVDAKEVNVSEPGTDDENALNPAKIFSLYEKGFKYSFVGEKTEGGKTVYEIDLFPENRERPYSRIKLFINKSDLTLNSLNQFGKDGINYLVKVKTMQTNLSFPDSEFIFSKAAYPGVEVIDMR